MLDRVNGDLAPSFSLIAKIVKIAFSLNLKHLTHCADCSLGFHFHVVVAKTLKSACYWLELYFLLLDYSLYADYTLFEGP